MEATLLYFDFLQEMISKDATELRRVLTDDNVVETISEMRQNFLKTLENLLIEVC